MNIIPGRLVGRVENSCEKGRAPPVPEDPNGGPEIARERRRGRGRGGCLMEWSVRGTRKLTENLTKSQRTFHAPVPRVYPLLYSRASILPRPPPLPPSFFPLPRAYFFPLSLPLYLIAFILQFDEFTPILYILTPPFSPFSSFPTLIISSKWRKKKGRKKGKEISPRK